MIGFLTRGCDLSCNGPAALCCPRLVIIIGSAAIILSLLIMPIEEIIRKRKSQKDSKQKANYDKCEQEKKK